MKDLSILLSFIVFFGCAFIVLGYKDQIITSKASNEPVPGPVIKLDDAVSTIKGYIRASEADHAPQLKHGDWINSEPLTLEKLKGRVVIVDFWTFGSYNCRNTLPVLKKLDETYREQGLTIIGVHTPEFDKEKVLNNVKSNVGKFGIKYPILTDNNYETWSAYNVRAWPSLLILDTQGRIRYIHVGEGGYEEQERVIKTLLTEKE